MTSLRALFSVTLPFRVPKKNIAAGVRPSQAFGYIPPEIPYYSTESHPWRFLTVKSLDVEKGLLTSLRSKERA
jgi:hypothetical protein